ncbi:hypothetical protein SEA_ONEIAGILLIAN_95 [Microbacterium phage OneinaGillian]|uniref:Uncharacterized protein n=1 Tax=Microbacterium phage OneinaGillian TaxID=2301604 RepID=A0A385UGS1_9CAUD|nr:hypothetical protein HOU23_gp095 [Microbacterium phage OneinaGillian]AYB70205.1 hypothetical protein SEA_ONEIAGILLIAN_95 [Microbacterium phage OneinaGillian]
MGHNTHEDVARRWANRALHPGRDALRSNNLHDVGDSILSYGSHFEVGRILRDRKGNPVGWLLNGNTWSVTTSRHQGAVRTAVRNTGLPVVTIPHQALDAAGIDLRTVQIIDVQRDWTTERVITKRDANVRWEYEYDHSDRGGWCNSLTGEFVARGPYWGSDAVRKPVVECDHALPDIPGPWKPGYNYLLDMRRREAREIHERIHHGVWEEVLGRTRNTGRKSPMATKYTPWEMVDDPEAPLGYVFERVVSRHWLGGSLIKAQVPYTVRQKHAACGGTGVAAEPWFTRGQSVGIGPLTEQQMQVAQDHSDFLMERNGGIRQPFGWSTLYLIDVMIEHTECRGCSGRGSTRVERRRWAYFLSAFDENETRPSYFFCELPPKVHPTTVEEALETLKPAAVKLAEQMGRDVKRQGDIFAIAMPGVTLRELKAQGGVHIRKPKLVDRDGRTVFDGPRPQLLNTNHEATEVVLVGSQTYARGTIKHVPDFRRPDHRPTPLGKEWHLIQKNTVPVSN